MKINVLVLLTFMSETIAVTNYISHIQNYVNLVSAYTLDGYSTTDFPPLADVSQPMVINIDIHLYAINGFDEVAGNIELVVAMVISWTDEMSTIHSITFQLGDRNEFLVPYNMIWTPMLVLSNAIGETSGVGDSAYLCRFDMRTQRVTWKPRVVVSSSCTPDVTYYPFDRQSCEFIYTAWGFKADEILLTTSSDSWNQDEYGESGEWNIASTSTETYTKAEQSYIKFTLNIVRKPLYFAFNILLPVLVLCLLNSTVFLLPAESGERVGFSVTCFLSFMVLLNMIMDIMPRSSSPISFLCYYLVVMMSNSGAMTLITILLMRVYHKPEKSVVPKWLQRGVTFVNCGCAKLVCCVMCCRAIRNQCSCRNKKLCGCFRRGDRLVEISVKDDKVFEKTKQKESEIDDINSDSSDTDSGAETSGGCFSPCRKVARSTRNKLFCCKKKIPEEADTVKKEPNENINQSDESFPRFVNSRNSLNSNENKPSSLRRADCCFVGDTIQIQKDGGTKEVDNDNISIVSDNEDIAKQVQGFGVNFKNAEVVCNGIIEKHPHILEEDDVNRNESYEKDSFSNAGQISLKHPHALVNDEEKGDLSEMKGSPCFTFLQRKKIAVTDNVEIDNEIVPHDKGNNETNMLRPSLKDSETAKVENVREGWKINQTEASNKIKLEPLDINKNMDTPQNNINSDTNRMREEAKDTELKTNSKRAKKGKKIKQKKGKSFDQNSVSKRNEQRNVGITSDSPKSIDRKDSQNKEVRFIKDPSEDEMSQKAFQRRNVSRRNSSVSPTHSRKISDGSLRVKSRRGSVKSKLGSETDDDGSADSDVDSLADLEEEVTWPEVGRILDKFFLLVFSGGQAFFTVVFLVPLFTAQSSTTE